MNGHAFIVEEPLCARNGSDPDANSLENYWRTDPRWQGVTRSYTAEKVLRLRGTIKIEHTIAEKMSRKLWHLLKTEPYVATLGALFEQPLSRLLEATFSNELVRGIVATDALIGTFADLADARLRQNRCFLYHVIGNGEGRWDVPVGGMGTLAAGLARAARRAGAQLRVNAPAVSIDADGRRVVVRTTPGEQFEARHLLGGVAPSLICAG